MVNERKQGLKTFFEALLKKTRQVLREPTLISKEDSLAAVVSKVGLVTLAKGLSTAADQ